MNNEEYHCLHLTSKFESVGQNHEIWMDVFVHIDILCVPPSWENNMHGRFIIITPNKLSEQMIFPPCKNKQSTYYVFNRHTVCNYGHSKISTLEHGCPVSSSPFRVSVQVHLLLHIYWRTEILHEIQTMGWHNIWFPFVSLQDLQTFWVAAIHRQ